MSKFFIQILLSVIVSAGTLVGFRSDLRAEVKESFHQANAAFQSASDVMSQITAYVSARLNTNATKENTKANAKTKSNIETQASNGGSLINSVTPALSVDGSSTVNSQNDAKVNAQETQLDLKNKTKSTLELTLEPIK